MNHHYDLQVGGLFLHINFKKILVVSFLLFHLSPNKVFTQDLDSISPSLKSADSILFSIQKKNVEPKEKLITDDRQDSILDDLSAIRMFESELLGVMSEIDANLSISGQFGLVINQTIENEALKNINYKSSKTSLSLFPFQFYNTISVDPNQNYFLIRGGSIDFSQTQKLLPGYKITANLDSSGNYVFYDEFGQSTKKQHLKETTVIKQETYIFNSFVYQIKNVFTKTVVTGIASKEERQSGAVRLFSTSVTTNETFQKIFGGDEVTVDATGNINLNVSGASEKSSNQNSSTGKNSQFIPKFEQQQKFNLRGTIGKKVEILFDQDSEREFSFENNIKITYTGFDDEILQKLEAGNIDLSLPGTQYVTQGGQNKGLFGVKSIFKFGDLTLTSIASIQNGEKKVIEINPGSGNNSTSIIKKSAKDYEKGKFFFLDKRYRDRYEVYDPIDGRKHTYDPAQEITNIRLFRKSEGNDRNPEKKIGVATYRNATLTDPNLPNLNVSQITNLDSANALTMIFLEVPKEQFSIEPRLGFITLNSKLIDGEALAVYYETATQVFGDVSSDTLKLKLIWKPTPLPTDSTWDLELKNIYAFDGITGLSQEEGESVKIRFKPASNNDITSFPNIGGKDRGLLDILHVDETGQNGKTKDPDQIIDDALSTGYGLDYNNGWIIFPRLRPFDPPTTPLTGFRDEVFPATNNDPNLGDVRIPTIYDQARSSDKFKQFSDRYSIEIQTKKSSSSKFSLGINVLEGSEVVRLDGDVLEKNIGYTIDYTSGELILIDSRATLSTANIKIEYEQAQLFQVDKKSIFGTRAEYSLSNYGLGTNSFIGTTALFHSQSTVNKRVQINEEPFNNFVWDVNTNIELEANYLTKIINYIPLVSSNQNSKINFAAEYAKLLPTPNTSNGLMEKDENGVAYIDDFEAIKRTYPMGSNRKSWTLASNPLEKDAYKRRKLIWYQNEISRSKISNIKTNTTDRATVLTLTLQNKLKDESAVDGVWGGVMRGFSLSSASELGASRFIEFWVKNNTPENKHAKINIEIGEISEDQNGSGGAPNREVKSALQPVIEKDQDIGLDDLNDAGEDSLLTRLGITTAQYGNLSSSQKEIVDSLQKIYPWGTIALDPEDPFGDNWNNEQARLGNKDIQNAEANRDIRNIKVNGFENNTFPITDGGLRVGDTEDINNNGVIDIQNVYARYSVTTDTHAVEKDIIVGRGEDDWVLYRLPILRPDTIINSNSIDQVLPKITSARIWISSEDPESEIISVQLTELQFINSEWKLPIEVPSGVLLNPNGKIPSSSESGKIVEISSISTDEGGGYSRPNGVKKEKPLDQNGNNTQREVKEQSLLLRLNELPVNSKAIISKTNSQKDFRNYGRIRMFVHGDKGGSIPLPTSSESTESPLRYFIRFADRYNSYYEVEQPIYAGWAEDKNSLDIDIRENLTSLKFKRTGNDTLTEYDIGENRVIRIKGNPSLDNVQFIYLGVHNTSLINAYTGEIWFNELRVTDADDKPGEAAMARLSLNMGDLLTLSGSTEYRSADFRTVEQRFNASGGNQKSWSVSGNLNLHKFHIERWGISLPMSFNANHSVSDPKFLANNDILVSDAKIANNEKIRTLRLRNEEISDSLKVWRFLGSSDSTIYRDSLLNDSLLQVALNFENTIKSKSFSRGFSLNFSKSKNEKDFWLLRWTINNITSSFNWSETETNTPTSPENISRNWSSNTTYNASFTRKSYKPLRWFPLTNTPFIGMVFKNISETDLNYKIITSVTTDFQITSTYSSETIRDAYNNPIKKPVKTSLTGSRGYGLSASPWQSLTSSLGVKYNMDLQGLSSGQILKGVARGLNPFDGFHDFSFDTPFDTINGISDSLIFNRDYSSTNTFTIAYSPQSFTWLTHTINYNAATGNGRNRAANSQLDKNATIQRSVQISSSFSLKSFIGSVKEPFKNIDTRSSSPGTDDPKKSRRDRFKNPGNENPSKSVINDSAKTSKSSSFLKTASLRAGSTFEKMLMMINDTRFNIDFKNSTNLGVLESEIDPTAKWFGYMNTDKSGVWDHIFTWDLDPVNQFNRTQDSVLQKKIFSAMSNSKTINYNFIYGFNFGPFTLDLKYDRTETRSVNYSNNIQDITIRRSSLFPYLKFIPFPFYEMTLRASNVGRWPIFNLLAGATRNINFSIGYLSNENTSLKEIGLRIDGIIFYNSDGSVDSSKTIQTIGGRRMQTSSIDKSITFPQISFDISWKGNVTQTISFSKSNTEKLTQQNTINSSSINFISNISYSKRGGFRIPIWFLKKKQLDNEVRMSSQFTYRKTQGFSRTNSRSSDGFRAPKNKTDELTSWSIEPRIDYSFTRWVTGGTFYRYEYNKNLTLGKTTRILFGLNVNITIGA